MDQAAPAVCFADSDDEDYVGFDEEELNKGIADLYDEDSASDYNDDVEEDEEVDLEEIAEAAMAPPPPQSAQSAMAANPYPTPMNVQRRSSNHSADGDDLSVSSEEDNQDVSKARSSNTFSLFSKKKKSSNSNKKKKEKESAVRARKLSDEAPKGGFFSAMASAVRPQQAPSRAKKSKASQLNKRVQRLQQVQQERKPKKDRKVVHRQKVNTNIISVDLGTLKNAADNISTGDAFACKQCKAILSKHDELLKSYEEIKLDDEDTESIWICKFCNFINIIEIDEEEIPKQESIDYILAPPASADDAKQSEQNADESQVIFCIDISGSMCVSQQIDSKHSQFKLRGNHLQQDIDNLSQFIDGNAQHLNAQSDIQYVSRLQCVQTAVDAQLANLSKSNPNYKIGLVSFNNDVTVIGDAMNTHEVVTGDKLNNMNKLIEIGEKCMIEHNIGESISKLSDALWKLSETGQTALGPALVVSIAMASAKPGSQVILCTDGLANIGVGSLDNPDLSANETDQIEHDDEEDDDPVLKWYQSLGDYAMSKGVVVNIISITDDGCKLENLGKIVEITNGTLRRISPLNLAEKFSGIIENESVATNCQAKMILHPGLKFHNTVEVAQIKSDEEEDYGMQAAVLRSAAKKKESAVKQPEKKDKQEPQEDTEMKSKDEPQEEVEKNEKEDKMNEGRKIYKIESSVQDCGNVFEGSRVFFEYTINKEKRDEFKTLKVLPFQTQIEYQKKDGSKMLRVISQTKEVTFDKSKVRQNLNFNVLAKYGTHVTTELAAKGDYESSRAWTAANTHYMNNNAVHQHQLLTLANYAQENVALDHQMQRQIQTESVQDEMADMMPFASYSVNNNNNNAYHMHAMAAPPPPQMSQLPQEQQSSSISAPLFSSKKAKLKHRKNARNDQFSSHIYNLKKKSHK